MSKNIKDICFVISARLSSQRLPRKMIKPFANTNLVEIACKKILNSKIIPKENFFFSAYEKEIIDLVQANNLQIFKRSKESAEAEGPISLIFEFHDKLDFKYVIVISACCPLIKVSTIDSFVQRFIDSKNEGLYGVIKKKNYFWDKNQNLITHWPEGLTCPNTKLVEETYEAANCLYAGRMDLISKDIWIAKPPYRKNHPELFVVQEEETLDIDYEWQFNYVKKIYSSKTNKFVK